MVEKITVNPESIRAYGNIITPKTASDFTPLTDYKVVQSTDTVYGVETTVYGIESKYTLSFDSESYTTSTGNITCQVNVTQPVGIPTGSVTVTGGGGSGSADLNVYGGATVYVSGITESGTLTATYKTGKATATVTYEQASYSLAFSQDTYTVDMLDGVTVSCTLKDGNTPMSGETVTFSWEFLGGTQSVTATTNGSGVATHTFEYIDFDSLPATVTATYSGVTATCTIVEG